MKYLFFFFSILPFLAQAQEGPDDVDWQPLEMMIVNGDTIYFAAQLGDVVVTSPRKFKTNMDRALYRRYKQYAAKVYPYAVEAVKLYRQMEEDTKDMSRRKKKRYIKKTRKEYKPKYKSELKNLTRLQGKILTKMIEKSLDKPMHEVIKETRGSFRAFYWNAAGRTYGYHLKEKYEVGQDLIMDIVLKDLEVKYQDVP